MFASPRIDISGLATSAGPAGNRHGSRWSAAVAGGAEAGGRTQVRAGTVPGAAPIDTVGARSWTLRISLCSRTVCCVPVRCPLPHIAVHIKKAPGLALYAHIAVCGIIAGIIRIAVNYIIPPRVRRGRACSAGILPLRFRGQYIRPTRRNIAGLLRIQTGEEFLDIIPGYLFHRTVSVAPIWLGVALSPSEFPVITASYWA